MRIRTYNRILHIPPARICGIALFIGQMLCRTRYFTPNLPRVGRRLHDFAGGEDAATAARRCDEAAIFENVAWLTDENETRQ